LDLAIVAAAGIIVPRIWPQSTVEIFIAHDDMFTCDQAHVA